MNNPSRLFLFAAGIVLGIIGTVFLPGQVRPYIPDWAMGSGPVAKGTVMAKQKKDGMLLLTVNTAQGALTATFTKKVDEIGLLVNEKDVIELILPTYAPLIEDPKIVRIVKEEQAASGPAPAGGAGENGPKEGKAGQPGKPATSAPAPGSTGGKDLPERK